MSDNEFHIALFLFLIRDHGYNSYYSLHRLMERIFGIYDVEEPRIIDQIRENRLAKETFPDQINHFTILPAGEQFLIDRENELKEIMKQRYYKKHPELIDRLL